ncbi:hypothetical protein PESHB5_01260 [Pediococcus parvulus]
MVKLLHPNIMIGVRIAQVISTNNIFDDFHTNILSNLIGWLIIDLLYRK